MGIIYEAPEGLTGMSRIKNLRCFTGSSSCVLKIDGCSVEYGTRFSVANLRIWGFGWAMNPTSYGHGQRPVPFDA